MEKNKLRDLLFGLSAIVLLGLAKITPALSFLIFIGWVPLFALLHNQQKESSPKGALILKTFIVLLATFLIWNITFINQKPTQWLLPLIYSTALTCSFIIFGFTDKHARNRLGFYTIPIYWLAIEFLLYQLHPQFSRFMLGSVLSSQPAFISWNVHTGFMGVSLWVLLSNITLFNAILKDRAPTHGNISWPALILAIAIIVIPTLLSNDTLAITQTDLLNEKAIAAKQVSGSGEYIGKTAVWVSILLILYSFVKKEVSK
ncbi:hypothetical protein GCM10009122_12210 [Fulvivirga kasyanovii]|uniref:Apolipoprotein N-acyltransferase N-terminal domain-containing protein n=1 Tax=Fulvivirga kasyanovii TaxID=396812 RepID=A0ABW9RMS6_9BACT|nr:hypothetical protein [Fulvivirga kasyanovii]MTI25001.1 hypothetical protein [Fulvivirga kasyanovii]